MKTQPKIKLTDLHLNDGSQGLPKNPRFIRDVRFKKLCDSIRDFPEAMPARGIVVDEAGVILGGNMRWRACQELGMKDIPTAWVHRLPGLTVAQKRRFIIMDNRAFGDDDMDLLANEWDIAELIGAGFDEEELTGLIDKDEGQDAEPQMDKAEELNKVWKVKTGDLWQIGEHRLTCGDCTDKAVVEWVMGGENADLCLTDPPYGVGVDYGKGKASDNAAAALNLAGTTFNAMREICRVIIWTPGTARLMAWLALYPPNWIGAWYKSNQCSRSPLGFGAWEPILFYFIGKVGEYAHLGQDAWNIPISQQPDAEGHPCPKSLKFWTELIAKDCDVLIEPFSGSGTTMVACQNLDRKCRGIEISPTYCAVVLQRMTDAFPGIKIEKIT